MDSDGEHTTNFGRMAVVYLLGLLIGGLYVGIVAPIRTVVQADFGIDDSTGIWMINIYTLFYAAAIPILGNLADRLGSKRVFTFCMGLFTLAATACGLSQFFGGFALLLAGRVAQAIGAGGMIPVATAALGRYAPADKRGMWLGMASATSGISNVAGAAVGSLITAVVGQEGWCWAFFVALPFGVLLVVAALAWLPKEAPGTSEKLDIVGSVLFVAFVLSLLFGLKGIDFSDVLSSFTAPSTFVPLILAVALAVAFYFAERRAAAPVFHLKYLRNRQIVIIMVVSFLVGCMIISMTLVPEFAEAVLNVEVGSGGYYMAVLGIFAIVGPPVCGKIIDAHGAKPPLACGLVATAAGFTFLGLVVVNFPSVAAMIAGLAIVGLGMGFAMGTPLNYMILANTPKDESATAIATISLVRQMGTTLAPALLVSFTTTGAGVSGYGSMMCAVAAFCVAAALVLIPYREVRKG